MAEILKLYKNLGETPLECIKRFKDVHPEHRDTKMTYLGRLDPMAEGLLVVLAGDTREKKKYLEWDKTYEFEVLWGVETDTYDILGVIKKAESFIKVDEKKLISVLNKILNLKSQIYPPYSSKTVGGKSLFMWARENKIDEIDVPERSIKIFDIRHIHTRLVSGKDVLKEALEKISLVNGDFRQEEILSSWQKVVGSMEQEKFLISKFVADVSSGTYIRGLAHEMGSIVGTPSLAWSIKRTRVGPWHELAE